MNVGRDPDNELVLDDPGVSRQHCLIETQSHAIVVKDRGTPNGTFINNEFLSEPRELGEGDRIYVGPFLLELISLAAETGRSIDVVAPMGPVLRQPSGSEDDRYAQRLLDWARRWDMARRPRGDLLRGRLLDEARTHVRAGPSDPLVRAFVRASARRRSLGRLAIVGASLALLAALGAGAWLWRPWDADGSSHHDAVAQAEDDTGLEPAPSLQPPTREDPTPRTWVEHAVIPAESLEDIARRYEVSVSNLARWNGLNPETPDFKPGQVLRVHAAKTPLPQQLIEFELDRDYDWKSLSERFDVDVDKLRAYNPGVEALHEDQRIEVWINPKPYGRRSALLDLPKIEIREGALSIGAPNQGKLQNGVQVPDSPLYIRRYPNIMWGSSHMIETLVSAVARFRQDLAFDHELVLADISKKNGGKFHPHKSHQAGRDIDIWMPTLKGVYKKKYLGDGKGQKERKPRPNEIDWHATWGLVRALLDTGEIVNIFLEYSLQENLYKAAKEMGATDEELSHIQWPRGKGVGVEVAHSAGHIGHIHVRFRCAPADIDCRNRSVAGVSDDQ